MSRSGDLISRLALKLAVGLLMAGAILLLVEGSAWIVAAVAGRDWRVDPLPQHPAPRMFCKSARRDDRQLRTCPEPRFEYSRVRAERYTLSPTRPRVVVIGESFVFGLGVEKNQAWPARLQHHLGSGYEVLNFGRCGTHAGLLVPVFKKVLALEPRVIVLAIGNNEHTMTTYYTGWAGRHPLKVYSISSRLGRIQLGGVLFRAMGTPPRAEESFDGPQQEFTNPVDKLVFAARRRPPNLGAFPDALAGPEVTEALEKEQRLKELVYRGHMTRMLRMARQAKITVVLATLPYNLTAPPTLSGSHNENTAQVKALLRQLKARTSRPEALVKKGLELDDRVAIFHFEHGSLLLHQRQRAEAAAAYRRAAEWDMIPDTTPNINTIIRQLSSEHDAPLAPLNSLAETHIDRPDLVFKDRVHLNPKGCDEAGKLVAGVVRGVLDR